MKRLALVILCILFISACASLKKKEFEQRMNSYIGVMTKDDALRIWGPPTSVGQGITREVWQYIWRGPVVYHTFDWWGVASQRGETLILYFDQRGILNSWSYRRY